MAPVTPKKAYHHGDLRGALVAAAEQLMAERVGWTFTLREVARVAGVSHNAPYNHFADRRALLAAVAARGFAELTDALRRSLRGIDPSDVAARIRAAGCAYVLFAAGHPSHYRLMFSAELADCEDDAFRASGEEAFGVLRGLIDDGVSAGRLRADPLGTQALTAWSLMHGLSTLVLDGKVPGTAGDEALSALAGVVSTTLLDGLCHPVR